MLHNVCFFYHKGLPTCNSTAFLSLAAQLWSHTKCFCIFSNDNIFLFLWEWPPPSGEVTLLLSFANILVTQWTKWHPYSSLIDCSTCSHLIALCHKSDSLNTWRHPYRYYWSLCARVLVKHLMLMEVGPEGAQLWILSLFPPMATRESFHFPFSFSAVFIFAQKLLWLPIYATSYGACW